MVRRIVTTIGMDGRSKICSDTTATNIQMPLPHINQDLKFHNLWMTDNMPVNADGNEDPVADVHVSTTPPKQGSVFRIVDFPPDRKILDKVSTMPPEALQQFSKQIGIDIQPNGPHPFMHTTETIDYGLVLSGEIYLILDEGETLLHPGDVVIQRATSHAWSNRSDQLCQVAFILLDAKH